MLGDYISKDLMSSLLLCTVSENPDVFFFFFFFFSHILWHFFGSWQKCLLTDRSQELILQHSEVVHLYSISLNKPVLLISTASLDHSYHGVSDHSSPHAAPVAETSEWISQTRQSETLVKTPQWL